MDNNQANYAANTPEKRPLDRATRLELIATDLPLGDKRESLVEEIQGLVKEVNVILERRDGLYMTPKKFREQRHEELAEEYAEKMVLIEEKHKALKELEKSMNLYDPEARH